MAYEPEPNVLKLWKNQKRESDKHANLTGQGLVVCSKCEAHFDVWVSAWVNEIKQGERAGQKWVKISLRPKTGAKSQSTDGSNDPF